MSAILGSNLQLVWKESLDAWRYCVEDQCDYPTMDHLSSWPQVHSRLSGLRPHSSILAPVGSGLSTYRRAKGLYAMANKEYRLIDIDCVYAQEMYSKGPSGSDSRGIL